VQPRNSICTFAVSTIPIYSPIKNDDLCRYSSTIKVLKQSGIVVVLNIGSFSPQTCQPGYTFFLR